MFCRSGSHKTDFPVPEKQREELFAIGGPLVRNVATPKGSAVIFTEALSHGAAVWQRSDKPRYSLFYKYNDRATVNGYPEDRRPSERAFSMMTDAQRAFFNRPWAANIGGEPSYNPGNTKPERWKNGDLGRPTL